MAFEYRTMANPGYTIEDLESIVQRKKLFVDGKIITGPPKSKFLGSANSTTIDGVRSYYSAPSTVCWTAELGIGIHYVTYQFEKTNGSVAEYSWQFEIMDDEEVIEVLPLPKFLGYVHPQPGQSYTLDEYNQLVSFSSFGQTMEPSICFSIGLNYFMEPGDFPTEEQMLSWIKVAVDGVWISQYSSLMPASPGGISAYDPQTNELLWRSPGGDFQLCYAAQLYHGIHTATILVDKSVYKRESYTWSFEIFE